MTVVILVVHTKVGVLLLYLVFEAVVGLYMERCTLMLETAGGVLVRGRRKRGRGGRKEVVEQACGRPTACVSLQQQEEAEVVEAELLRRLFARHVETPLLFPCLLLV